MNRIANLFWRLHLSWKRLQSAAILLAELCLGVFAAHAQDATWAPLDPGADQQWTHGANWSTGTVPTGTAFLGVPPTVGGITGNGPLILGAAQIGLIEFESVTTNYSIGIASTLTITGSGVTNLSTIHQVIVVTSAGTLTFDSGSAGNNTTIGYGNRGGAIVFNSGSTAGSALFENQSSGTITFQGGSTAGNAGITNNFLDGTITFQGDSTAGSAGISNGGGVGMPPGTRKIIFTDTSNAEGATISNGSFNGFITFQGASDAGKATIENALSAIGGTITFQGSSNADGATITNFNASGIINFDGQSQAGSASISNAAGGTINFLGLSDAEGATITNATANGIINFDGQSKAGSAKISNSAGAAGGTINFLGSSDAVGATITNLNSSGIINFEDQSTAGSAIISNSVAGATINFLGSSDGGSSSITNSVGGMINLRNNSSADRARINNMGTLSFSNTSTAGNATITTNSGGITTFNDTSDGGNATITTNSGGIIKFFDSSTGGTARFITVSGGVFDMSNLTSDGMTAGSIEGAGNYFLGSKELTTGLNNLSTEVSGVISDGGSGAGTGGSLTKAGSGTLTLTGENTYTGGTTITGGTLQLGDGGTTGSILGDVDDNGTLVFNHGSGTTTFPGVISGSGNVIKVGGDTLVLTADNSYGDTTIYDGTLVAGTPVASQAISYALGNGNVFLLGGTLRTPSLDPEVIHVGGNYTQGPRGTLELGIAGLNGSQYDHVQVGGHASLNGTLSVTSLNGFHPANGNAFEVLSSVGTTTGQFAQIVDRLNNNPGLQRVDIYAPNGVALLYVTPTTPPAPGPPGTPPPPINEIDSNPLPPVNADEPLTLSRVLAILFSSTADELTSLFEISFSGLNSQRFNLEDRLTQIQQGSTGFVSNISPAPPPPSGKEIEEGKSVVEKQPVLQPSPQNRWGVWVNGWGDFVSVGTDNFARGYDFTTGGVTVGIDYRITDHLALGLAGTYAHTWTSLQPTGDVDANTGSGQLYGTYFSGGFYVNGAVFAGYNSYDTSRQAFVGMATGSTEGYEVSTFLESGYNFHFGNLTVGPIAALQYSDVHIDGFDEHGTIVPAQVHSDAEDSLRTDFGFRASYTFHCGSVILFPYLRAAWEHEYLYSALPITFSSTDFPGVSATVFGPSEGHDSAIVNAGLGVQWTPRLATSIGYQGQLGRGNYSANGVTGTISFSF